MAPVKGNKRLIQQPPTADFDPQRFDYLFVERPTVTSKGVKPADAAHLSAVLEEALKRQLGNGRRIVDRPGPRTLHVRAAITRTSEADVDLNILTSLLAIPFSEGSMAAEAEILDGGDGKRVAAMSWTRSGGDLTDVGLDYTRLGHARSGLRAFAAKLANLIEVRQVLTR